MTIKIKMMTGGLAMVAGMALAACDESALTSADIQAGAKERVRSELGLSEDAALFTETFVGQPLDGDTTVCGIVEGRTADGQQITPRRFIAAADPARWVKMEPVTNVALPTQPDKFPDWYRVCEAQES